MQEIHSRNDNQSIRRIYKITKGSEIYIFKSIDCSLDDEESKKNLIEEYEINLKSSELSEGVVKPHACVKREIIVIKRFIIEILYEYAGENLLLSAKEEKPENIMKYMTSVATTMKVLEKNSISHYDLKPENMVIKNGVVKIIDFGISREFNSKTRLLKTTTVKGHTYLYTPPEVISNMKSHPVKVDVYCWGMTLYQLITNKADTDLEVEHTLRTNSKTYGEFLEKVKGIVVMGDDRLKRRVREILLYVLNERHENRPRFTELCDLLQDDKKINELEGDRILMEKRAKNINDEKVEENSVKLLERLFNELQEESKEVHEKVKFAYDRIIKGEISCSLNSVRIMDTGAEIIAFALNKSSNLKELNLGFNNIQIKGIEVLAEGLKRCTTLRILILGRPKRKKNEKYLIDSKTKKPLEEGKETSSTTDYASKGLAVGGNATSIGGAIASGVGALVPKVAPVLNVAGPVAMVVGAAVGVARFAYTLTKSKPEIATREVDDPELGKINNLGTRGTKAIADYLRDSKLEEIDLSYCNISSEAIQDLVEAANACKTLKSISIKGNSLPKDKCDFKKDLVVEY